MKLTRCGLFLVLLSIGCASAPRLAKKVPPEELLEQACSAGKRIQSVRGTVWLKTSSKEISGQFSANVTVAKADQLKLEVTNFLGGTEALISVSDEHYVVTGIRGNRDEKNEGYGTWGGIPLKWATELFLGRVPCPLP